MKTAQKHPSASWYDTPYGRLAEQAGHRRPQPSVAQVLAHLTDDTQVGLGWAVSTGSVRLPG